MRKTKYKIGQKVIIKRIIGSNNLYASNLYKVYTIKDYRRYSFNYGQGYYLKEVDATWFDYELMPYTKTMVQFIRLKKKIFEGIDNGK